jgi:hypothetical protein
MMMLLEPASLSTNFVDENFPGRKLGGMVKQEERPASCRELDLRP